MRKLKLLITTFTLLLFVGITNVMQSMEVEEVEEVSEEKDKIWIKASGKVIEIPKQEVIRLEVIQTQLGFRKQQGRLIKYVDPVDLDKFIKNLDAAEYVVEYLRKNDTEREVFLQGLDQKSLKIFLVYLGFLLADPKLILLPKALNYFGNWRLEKVLDGHRNIVRTMAFSPDSKYLVSGSDGTKNNLILWNARTGEKIKVLDGHMNTIFTVKFSPDGNFIVSGSFETKNNIILWNGRTGEKIKILDGHRNIVRTMVFSSDSNFIVSYSRGTKNNLILWNGRTGKQIKVLDGHNDTVTSVVFSPDGNYIISGSRGTKNNLILWNGRTGKQIKVLDGHNDPVTSVVFSPDGNYIVSGSWGTKNNLILWNGRTGEKIKVLDGHRNTVYSVVFSQDSNFIVSRSDGTQNNLILWKIYSLYPELLTPQEAGFLYHTYWAVQHDKKMDASVEDYEIFAEFDSAIQEKIEATGVLHID